MICDQANSPSERTHEKRVTDGAAIAMKDVEQANVHMHGVLYGLMQPLLEKMYGKPLEDVEQVRIPVVDAPKRGQIALPTFLDIGRKDLPARIE
jgi:hypothetical protein